MMCGRDRRELPVNNLPILIIKKSIRYFKSVLICVNLCLKNHWKMLDTVLVNYYS